MSGPHRKIPPRRMPCDRPGLAWALSVRPPSTVELSRHDPRFAELNRCTLTMIGGGMPGAVFTVGAAPLLLGRSQECELRFDDPSVSAVHAEISRAAGEVYLRDLGSTNGTFVNGAALIKPRALQDGDRVQLGRDGVVRVSFGDEGEERARKALYERAIRDRLTGLYNRAFFDERIEIELASARRHDEPLSLLLLDVDHFKALNDRYGHLAGDEALRVLGAILRKAARKEDIAARFGGEELVLLARGIGLAKAGVIAERLRRTIRAARISYLDQNIAVSASIGVAARANFTHFRTPAELINAADRALYEAKRGGRDRVAFANEVT